MSDYERIKGKLFLVEEVANGEKSLEEWCEFYVKYVLECSQACVSLFEINFASSYKNYIEQYHPCKVLFVSDTEVYIIHTDDFQFVNPSMTEIIMKGKNEFHFDIITTCDYGSWIEQLKEAL